MWLMLVALQVLAFCASAAARGILGFFVKNRQPVGIFATTGGDARKSSARGSGLASVALTFRHKSFFSERFQRRKCRGGLRKRDPFVDGNVAAKSVDGHGELFSCLTFLSCPDKKQAHDGYLLRRYTHYHC